MMGELAGAWEGLPGTFVSVNREVMACQRGLA